MDERSFRRVTANDNRMQQSSLRARPDRIAFWAVAMAVVAMVAAAASASAQGSDSGGAGAPDGGTEPGACADYEFGKRTLAHGDCGDDVLTLNWILHSTSFGKSVGLAEDFGDPTETSVQRFEGQAGLTADGVVDRRTRESLVRTMPKKKATWYGPGFFGNRTACGERLRRNTVGVAHKKLPCGSKVVVRYKGSYLRTEVIDRGPYANGAKWDLTQKAARLLDFEVTDKVRAAKVSKR